MSMRFLDTLLYNVKPNDPATLGVLAAVLLVVSLLASYVPARRATRVVSVNEFAGGLSRRRGDMHLAAVSARVLDVALTSARSTPQRHPPGRCAAVSR